MDCLIIQTLQHLNNKNMEPEWASLIPKAIDKQKMNFPELSELDNALAKNFVKLKKKSVLIICKTKKFIFK